jgi:hypothetical protein
VPAVRAHSATRLTVCHSVRAQRFWTARRNGETAWLLILCNPPNAPGLFGLTVRNNWWYLSFVLSGGKCVIGSRYRVLLCEWGTVVCFVSHMGLSFLGTVWQTVCMPSTIAWVPNSCTSAVSSTRNGYLLVFNRTGVAAAKSLSLIQEFGEMLHVGSFCGGSFMRVGSTRFLFPRSGVRNAHKKSEVRAKSGYGSRIFRTEPCCSAADIDKHKYMYGVKRGLMGEFDGKRVRHAV